MFDIDATSNAIVFPTQRNLIIKFPVTSKIMDIMDMIYIIVIMDMLDIMVIVGMMDMIDCLLENKKMKDEETRPST